MHMLATSSASLDDIVEPVDLRQTPGDIVVLSFADSDLAGLAAAWQGGRGTRCRRAAAALRDLRHPMSVDLWIERVAAHAKVIVVRMLGGSTGGATAATGCRRWRGSAGIALALLPGEDRDDPRLAESSTLPRDELDALLGYFREGGPREYARAAAPAGGACRSVRIAARAAAGAAGRPLCARQRHRRSR